MAKDNNPLFLFTLVTVFEGLITGVNIAGISGAIPLIQESWEVSDLMLGILVGMLMLGCCLGSCLGFSRIGKSNKKQTLLLAAILLIVSPLGCTLSSGILSLFIYRFAGGIGLGLIWAVTPIYLSDLFPARIRSSLLSYGYLAIAIGILMAYIADYLLLSQTYNWHLMLGFPLLFGIAYGILVLLVPASKSTTPPQSNQTDKTLIGVILIGLQQLSGISIIFNYTASVFEATGLEHDMALSQSVFVGIINLLFTLSAIWLIKNRSTTKWLVWGSLGMTGSLLYMAYTFAVPPVNGTGFMIATFCYLGGFTILSKAATIQSCANIPYRKISDRSFQLTVCFFSFISILLFPWILNSLGGSVAFGVLGGFSISTLLYVMLCIPEIKTKPIYSQTQNNINIKS